MVAVSWGEVARMPAHYSRSGPIKDIASLFLECSRVFFLFFCQNTCSILGLLPEDLILFYSLIGKTVCLCMCVLLEPGFWKSPFRAESGHKLINTAFFFLFFLKMVRFVIHCLNADPMLCELWLHQMEQYHWAFWREILQYQSIACFQIKLNSFWWNVFEIWWTEGLKYNPWNTYAVRKLFWHDTFE